MSPAADAGTGRAGAVGCSPPGVGVPPGGVGASPVFGDEAVFALRAVDFLADEVRVPDRDQGLATGALHFEAGVGSHPRSPLQTWRADAGRVTTQGRGKNCIVIARRRGLQGHDNWLL